MLRNSRLLNNSATWPAKDAWAQQQSEPVAPTQFQNLAEKIPVLPPRPQSAYQYAGRATRPAPVEPTVSPQALLVQTLDQWAKAVPEEVGPRSAARDEIWSAYLNRSPSLSLHNLDLSCLPDCMVQLTSLECLNVAGNKLVALPELPPGLSYLYADNNQLTTLPELPVGLTDLRLGNNTLTALPELPGGVTRLAVYGNKLTGLPTLPEDLIDLNANGNELTALPELPRGLTDLNVGNNKLIALPELPEGLIQIGVSNNQLIALPVLPAKILWLHADHNQLIKLPPLPPELHCLSANNNQLVALPELPKELFELYAKGNRLTALPALPDDLECIKVKGNQLVDMPLEIMNASNSIQKWQLNHPEFVDHRNIIFTASPVAPFTIEPAVPSSQTAAKPARVQQPNDFTFASTAKAEIAARQATAQQFVATPDITTAAIATPIAQAIPLAQGAFLPTELNQPTVSQLFQMMQTMTEKMDGMIGELRAARAENTALRELLQFEKMPPPSADHDIGVENRRMKQGSVMERQDLLANDIRCL